MGCVAADTCLLRPSPPVLPVNGEEPCRTPVRRCQVSWRSEVPPQPPPDWHLHAELSCTCADCRELQAFARDPIERVHRFRIKKERRRHLHQVINQFQLDMTHVTERIGSPQSLVCTKDRRTFKARMKEYQNELAAMRKLVKLVPKSAAAAALSKRMESAAQASTI